jgi:hypothetical protein
VCVKIILSRQKVRIKEENMCAIFMEQIHIEHIPEIGMRSMGITHYTCSYIPVHILFLGVFFLLPFSVPNRIFGRPGSGSGYVIICTDLDLDPAPDISINEQKFKNNFNCYCFLPPNDLLSLKSDVNYKQKNSLLLTSRILKATDEKSSIRILIQIPNSVYGP